MGCRQRRLGCVSGKGSNGGGSGYGPGGGSGLQRGQGGFQDVEGPGGIKVWGQEDSGALLKPLV